MTFTKFRYISYIDNISGSVIGIQIRICNENCILEEISEIVSRNAHFIETGRIPGVKNHWPTAIGISGINQWDVAGISLAVDGGYRKFLYDLIYNFLFYF